MRPSLGEGVAAGVGIEKRPLLDGFRVSGIVMAIGTLLVAVAACGEKASHILPEVRFNGNHVLNTKVGCHVDLANAMCTESDPSEWAQDNLCVRDYGDKLTTVAEAAASLKNLLMNAGYPEDLLTIECDEFIGGAEKPHLDQHVNDDAVDVANEVDTRVTRVNGEE